MSNWNDLREELSGIGREVRPTDERFEAILSRAQRRRSTRRFAALAISLLVLSGTVAALVALGPLGGSNGGIGAGRSSPPQLTSAPAPTVMPSTVSSATAPSTAALNCATPPSPGGYQPTLTPASGVSGATVTVSGIVPVYAKDGSYVGPSGSVQLWWNADPAQWVSLVTGSPSPLGSGSVVPLGQFDVSGACSYQYAFQIPDVPQGTYTIVALEVGGGSAALLGAMTFQVN